MKHCFLLIAAMFCGLASMEARPVDVETAKTVGQEFLKTKINNQLRTNDLQLVYTGISERNEPCFFAFNSGDDGFVLVSADDRFRPIVGYSNEGPFDIGDMSPELAFYLDKIIEARTSRDAVLLPEARAEWSALLNGGSLPSRNGGKAATYICTTKWNQDSPYNLYSPSASNGPGGRCYAGCVATAMSQVMKHWNHPTQGTGSHSYHSNYGLLTANFGTTTYDWDNMPNQIIGASPQEQIEAIALLMYHCGVAVDMMFSPSGSGAYSTDVPDAIRNHFSYSDQSVFEYRNSYSLVGWQNKLKASFDLNWPLYYSGYSDSGGHAFVCDGYDDNDLFHYNWGWGGSGDGWFVIDEIDYASWAGAIFNFVPTEVFLYMPKQPENLTVTSHGDGEFSATLNWTNPTHNIHDQALTSIDQIVVKRDGETIFSQENVAPGAAMSFTDHYLPTMVSYSVYAIVNSATGSEASAKAVLLGPTTQWTVDMTSADPEGWGSASISFVNSAGIEVANATTASASSTQSVSVPTGNIYLYWNRPSHGISHISFDVKDGTGQSIVSFASASNNLDKGLFHIANHSSGDRSFHDIPTDLTATVDGNDVKLGWNGIEVPVISYCIYRDGLLYDIAHENQYTDINAAGTFHSYHVTSFNDRGESYSSNICNLMPQSDCAAPHNFSTRIVNKNKVEMQWDAVEETTPSAYAVMLRQKGQTFDIYKLWTTTLYNCNLNVLSNDRYDFALCALYETPECESGYANAATQPELNFVTINKTIIPLNLRYTNTGNSIVLDWDAAMRAETYNVYRNGELIAEGIAETTFTDETVDNEQDYCYRVTGATAYIESNPTNEVCVDWSFSTTENNDNQCFSIFPNPTTGLVGIEGEAISHVIVTNLLGQVVMRQTVGHDQATLDLTSLPDGTYFIKALTDAGIATKKVVKMQ